MGKYHTRAVGVLPGVIGVMVAGGSAAGAVVLHCGGACITVTHANDVCGGICVMKAGFTGVVVVGVIGPRMPRPPGIDASHSSVTPPFHLARNKLHRITNVLTAMPVCVSCWTNQATSTALKRVRPSRLAAIYRH